jgi:hypothetical protein
VFGLMADLAHAGLSGHAANLSLIDSAAFFDRSYRYNRPPEAPPFRAGWRTHQVYNKGLECK